MLAENLPDLFQRGPEYAYDCEHRLLRELPKMEQAASSHLLKNLFLRHLEDTGSQKERLDQIFSKLQRAPAFEHNEPIKVIASEGEKMIRHIDRSPLLDAALIFYANQIAHYKIALYGSLHSFARTLQLEDVANLIDLTLAEEKTADHDLTQLAESSVNQEASRVQNTPPFAII